MKCSLNASKVQMKHLKCTLWCLDTAQKALALVYHDPSISYSLLFSNLDARLYLHTSLLRYNAAQWKYRHIKHILICWLCSIELSLPIWQYLQVPREWNRYLLLLCLLVSVSESRTCQFCFELFWPFIMISLPALSSSLWSYFGHFWCLFGTLFVYLVWLLDFFLFTFQLLLWKLYMSHFTLACLILPFFSFLILFSTIYFLFSFFWAFLKRIINRHLLID